MDSLRADGSAFNAEPPTHVHSEHDHDADRAVVLFAELALARDLRDTPRVARLQARLRKAGWAAWPIAAEKGGGSR